MQIDEVKLMHSINKLEHFLIRNEKQSSIEQLVDYYSMIQLIYDMFGVQIDTNIFLNNKKRIEAINKYYIKNLNTLVSFSNENAFDLSILSNNFNYLLPKYLDVYHKADVFKVSNNLMYYTEEDFKELIYSFFSMYGNSTLKFIKNIIENNRIELGSFKPLDSGAAYTVSSFLTNDVYIISSIFDYTVDSMSVLAHGLGHAIDMMNVANYQGKKNYAATPFLEVPSCFFEISFLNYLMENKIETNTTLNIIVDRMINQTANFNVYSGLLIDKVGEYSLDINGYIVKTNTSENLIGKCYRDDLIYFLGYVTAFNMLKVSENNEKEYMKYFNNFSTLKHEQSFEENIETLGIDFEKYLENSLIENYIKDNTSQLIKKHTI